MNEPRHGTIVSGEVIPPQTYLHKVAAAKHDDPADDDAQENTAPENSAPENTAATEDITDDVAGRDEPESVGDVYDADAADESAADTVTMPAAEADTANADDATDAAEPETAATDTAAADTAVMDTAVMDTAVMDAARPDTASAGVAETPRAHERRPGDVPIPDDVSLIGDGTVIRDQWMRVQASFVDNPRAAVSAAATVITDAVAAAETAVRERQQALRARWDGDGHTDTEALRVTMQQYRQLLERLTAL